MTFFFSEKNSLNRVWSVVAKDAERNDLKEKKYNKRCSVRIDGGVLMVERE